MKRLVIKGPREAYFEDVPIPECTGDGLLIRAEATAISTGTELRVYRWIPVDEEGKFLHAGMAFPDEPVENGYSMVGRVVEVGRDVTGFAEGDRVFLSETHKEYAAVGANTVVKLPDGIPTDRAAMLNILGVGHISLRTGEPAPGESVAVIGLGVVGLSALAYCRAFGLRTAGIDMSEGRLGIASKMGADLAVSPAAPGFRERIDDLFDGEGADVVIEAASTWRAIQTGMDIVRQDGKVVVIARHTDMPHYNLVGHPYLAKRISLRTAYGYQEEGHRWDRGRCMDLTIGLLAQGRLDIGPMLTHRVGWQELPDIYRRLDEGDLDIVGVTVDWTDSG
jgi:threonine dehydrogenase-like Zn-dependent dehydrogenase